MGGPAELKGTRGLGKRKKAQRVKASAQPTGSLAERLLGLLDSTQTARDLQAELENLERRHGPAVYCEWLYRLGGLRADPKTAQEDWRAVLNHWTDLETKRPAAFDPRVALVSYSIEAQRKRDRAIDIEIHLRGTTREDSNRDELTGLASSQSFLEGLERELHRGERLNRPVTLLMIAVDDLEQYNDRNGREAGDRALARIGRILVESLRGEDGKARFGGKEFAVTLPDTPKLSAGHVAERLREKTELQYFPGEDDQPGGALTVCVGVATFPGDARNASELLRQAQRAMAAATASGRNRVHLIGEDRRSNRRFEVSLVGTFTTVAGDHPLRTLNLSLTGLKFSSSGNLPSRALADIRLKIPGSQSSVDMAVRAVKSETVRPPSIDWTAGGERMVGGQYEVAARAVEISSADLRNLANYLRTLEDSSSPGSEP